MTSALDSYSPITQAATGLPDPTSPKTADAARQFEAYMVSFLAQQMRATLPEGMMTSGPMATFSGLFDQEIGRRVAETGGLGLGKELERMLAEHGVPTAQQLPRPAPHGRMPMLGEADNAHAAQANETGLIGRITSIFGKRKDPFTGDLREHDGIDIAGAEGSPIRPATGGKVTFAGDRGGYGNCVVVAHPDGSESRYAHCKELKVNVGDTVDTSTELATIGSTGRSTGPHLHFEVRKDGRPVDPIAWLKEKMIAVP